MFWKFCYLGGGGVIVRGVFVLGGNCPGGNCPGGNCPGGNCPRTSSRQSYKLREFAAVIYTEGQVNCQGSMLGHVICSV